MESRAVQVGFPGRRQFVVLVILLACVSLYCGRVIAAETVSQHIKGCLIADGPLGAIDAYCASSGWQRQVLKPPYNRGHGAIGALSGPDAKGLIACLKTEVSGGFWGGFSCRVVAIDAKTHREASSSEPRQFDFFSNVIGLSPVGEKVAYFRKTKWLRNGSRTVSRLGELDLYDMKSQRFMQSGIQCVNDRFSWFPSGRRLAYTHLLDPKKSETLKRKDKDFAEYARTGEQLCGVSIFDISTSSAEFLTWGWHPLVSTDGSKVLIDRPFNTMCVNLGTRAVQVSSGSAGPSAESTIAFVEGRYAVHRNPDQTVSVTDLQTMSSEVLVSKMDPHSDISYGTTDLQIGTK